MPTVQEAVSLAESLLADSTERLCHMQMAGWVAGWVGAALLPTPEAELLVAAACLHDIGYSRRIAGTGFHPADGARFLLSEGFSPRLVSLVAHHSHACVTAPEHGIADLAESFPPESVLLHDALCFSDMHSSPTGKLITFCDRLADIRARHATTGATEARLLLVRGSVDRVRAQLAATVHEPILPAHLDRALDRHAP